MTNFVEKLIGAQLVKKFLTLQELMGFVSIFNLQRNVFLTEPATKGNLGLWALKEKGCVSPI
jgi:hypothetical protein